MKPSDGVTVPIPRAGLLSLSLVRDDGASVTLWLDPDIVGDVERYLVATMAALLPQRREDVA